MATGAHDPSDKRATENNQAEEHFEDNLATAAIKEKAFKKSILGTIQYFIILFSEAYFNFNWRQMSPIVYSRLLWKHLDRFSIKDPLTLLKGQGRFVIPPAPGTVQSVFRTV